MNDHLQNDLKKLREGIDGFDSLPYPLKEVLLDIRYNTGAVSQTKWPNLRNGIREKNLTKIYHNVNRLKIQENLAVKHGIDECFIPLQMTG